MKILKVFLSIIIFITFIFIGAPIEYNCFELNLAIILMGMILGIYKIIVKKEKLINSKIDLVVLMFYLAPIIPIIFGTCDTLEETLIALIRNMSLFNIYCIVKDIITKGNKEENWIINVLIAGGVLLVLLGIDERLSRTIFQYAKYIGILSVTNIENRMFSTLGYANSFAIIMAIEIFLCFSRLKHNKIFYSGLIYLFSLGMLLSYSRTVIALFAVLFVVYLIFVKKRRVYITYNMFQNLIITLFSMKIFETLSKQHILAWISVIIFFMLSIVIARIISKNYKKICRIKLKIYVRIMILLIIFVSIVYFVGKQLDIPLHVFDYGEVNQEIRYKLYNIEKEKEYCYEFDLEANVTEGTEFCVYRIVIAEENKYYDTINTHEIQLKNSSEKEKIKFTTSSETVAIVIYVKSDFPRYQNGLTINSLYINNEKYGLNYLYIPTQLVERIESFSISHKSLWERLVYYKDAMKIIEKNVLFGVGAKGWLYNYEDIQSYKYASTEVHNYALQIFIDNGIIGFLLLLVIIVYAIIKILKRKNITEIDIAFILLTLHALVDFDLSFYVIIVMWLVLFTLTIQKDKDITCDKTKKISQKLQILIILLNVIMLCIGVFTYKIQKKNESILEEISYLIETDNNQAIELMRNFKENKKYKWNIYESLVLIDYADVEEENLEYVYELIESQEIVANTTYNVERNEIVIQVIKTSTNTEFVKKFCNLIIEENEAMVSNINDKERNRLTQEEMGYYLQIQNEMYNLANEIVLEN